MNGITVWTLLKWWFAWNILAPLAFILGVGGLLALVAWLSGRK